MVLYGSSSIDGRGAFADSDISIGDTVYMLGGERRSVVGCGWRIMRRRLRWDDPLQVGRFTYICLDARSVLFNHSCDPTCGIRGDNELFALQAIAPGDELTFDYSLTVRPGVFTRRWAMRCSCGSVNCRVEIGNFSTIPKETLRRYVDAGSFQDYVSDLL